MGAVPALVLLVETDRHLRERVEHLLRLRDFDVTTAETLEAAFQAIDARPPDAAIVDLHLKRGCGDLVVRLPRAAPVIVMTATPMSAGAIERLRPGTRLADKSCSITWLIDTLAEMLASRRPGRGESARPCQLDLFATRADA